MDMRYLIGLSALALATGGCQSRQDVAAAPAATAAPIAEADAAKIADATLVAWTSMDVAKIKALYAPDIVGFDIAAPPLSTDRATWDKLQDTYAAMKIDKGAEKQRNIQVLGPDSFVVSGVWDISSSAIPANALTIRCTDIYRKAADGSWPIVNEHCSAPYKG